VSFWSGVHSLLRALSRHLFTTGLLAVQQTLVGILYRRFLGLNCGRALSKPPRSVTAFTWVLMPLPKSSTSPLTRAAVLTVFIFVSLGAFLDLVQGGRFVFFYSAQYTQAALVAFLVLLPACAGLLLTQPRFIAHMQWRYPTPWVRWLFLNPLITVIAAGAIVVAPRGWLVAGTWAFGIPQAPLVAKVISVEQFSARKGCDQRATLNLLSVQVTICLADHYVGAPLRTDQEVLVSGKASLTGFLIGDFTAK